MKKIAAVLLLADLLLALLAGCGGSGMGEEEIRETFRTLVEASYELNEIYFGSGLPYEVDLETMMRLMGITADMEEVVVNYMPVTKDAAYQSEAEIREATKKVFSDDISSHLFTLGFEGLRTDTDESVSFARFIEEQGILTVRIDLDEEALPMGRTYDFSRMEILIEEPERIRASFPSLLDGRAAETVRITIIKTADGWRLDSPTY